MLDLGAGDGRLAAALADAGHQVTAVEPFRPIRAAGGLTVLRTGVGEVELPERSFDAAVLWHVLEHLPEPLAALESVRRWLVPGGRLLVGVPNLDSLQADIGGERWFHLDPQRHVVHFTPSGLLALLTRAGFSDVRRRAVLVDQALAGMWMTLLNRVTGRRDALRGFVRREPVARRDLALTAALAVPLLPPARAPRARRGRGRPRRRACRRRPGAVSATVVVPTRLGGDPLERLLDSLAGQSVISRTIVVDNAAPDRSRRARCAPRVRRAPAARGERRLRPRRQPRRRAEPTTTRSCS